MAVLIERVREESEMFINWLIICDGQLYWSFDSIISCSDSLIMLQRKFPDKSWSIEVSCKEVCCDE